MGSAELDVVVLDALPGWGDLAQQISGAIGEGSDLQVTHGYYADGMTLDEAALPCGWEGRLRSLNVHRISHPDAPATLYAPELADPCASKLAANRSKDRAFTKTVVAAGPVGANEVLERCRLLLGDTSFEDNTLCEDKMGVFTHGSRPLAMIPRSTRIVR